MRCPAYEGAIVTCGLALLLLQGASLARSAASRWCRGRGRLSPAAWRRGLAAWWWRDTDLFGECVAARARYFMAKKAVGMWYICANVLCGVVIVVDFNICTGATRWYSATNDVVLLLLAALMIALSAFPRLSQGRLLCFWYSLGSSLATVFVAGTANIQSIGAAGDVFVFRLFLASAVPRVGWGIFWNTLHCVVVSYKSTVVEVPDGSVILPKTVILQQAAEALAIVFCMHGFSQSLWANARHEVREMTLRGTSSGMLSLLNLVCDVVVELDAELRITEHAPKFAAVLSLAPFKSTKGMPILEFMPLEADRSTFETHLRAHEKDASSRAGALHVRLRDNMTGHLNMEVFYVQFTGLDDSRHYFVGMREFTEQPVPALRSFARGRPGSARHGPSLAAEIGRGTSPVVESQAFSEEASVSARSRASSGCRPSATELGRGTRPVVEWHSLSDEASAQSGDDSSTSGGPPSVGACSSPSSTGGARASFRPTSDVGKDLTVVAAMAQWHLPGGADRCCPFHVAVADLRGCFERLEGSGCAPISAHKREAQCRYCGLIVRRVGRRRTARCLCGHRQWRTRQLSMSL